MQTQKMVQTLRRRLRGQLPGWDAQSNMATRVHREARIKPPSKSRKAGVMILLYPDNGQLWIPLIKRPVYEGVHSGQMALPGGKVEETDKDIVDTAVRETEEEIGVSVDRKQIVGTLSDLYIPPSNMMVTPILSIAHQKPVYQPDPSEVAGIFDIKLDDLLDPGNRQEVEVGRFNDTPLEAPAFMISNKVIWGATAMMLSEFLYIIQELD